MKSYKWKLMNTQQVFTKIYTDKIWGDTGEEFFSGGGSSNSGAYPQMLVEFIQKNNITNVVDCGCGDFRVMNQVTAKVATLKYHGIDVVNSLIEYNQQKYGSDQIKFSCINAINHPLPDGEMIVIRQVLQHLSNRQIKRILKKTKKFKYVLITEHVPSSTFTPNIDKSHGPGIRLDKNSGVLISEAPFNIKCDLILSVPQKKHGVGKGVFVDTCINTYLVKQ